MHSEFVSIFSWICNDYVYRSRIAQINPIMYITWDFRVEYQKSGVESNVGECVCG